MKGSAKTCFGDIKTLNTFLGNQYLSVNAEGKRRLAVEAKQKWTHNYYVKRMKKLDKDFNGHDEDGGGPCHTHLVAKGRVRGFVVGLFGEVSSDTLTLVRHCVDMIAYRVWKRSGFSSASECCAVLLPYWKKKLMISCLRGVAQLIHTRAEEGGLGTADGKQKKMEKSKDSVQRAIKIAEKASRNQAHMILDMRGQ